MNVTKQTETNGSAEPEPQTGAEISERDLSVHQRWTKPFRGEIFKGLSQWICDSHITLVLQMFVLT